MTSAEPTFALRQLSNPSDAELDALADVLDDCVEGGASVSFMHPLGHDRALAFWQRIAQDVRAGKRALIVAEDAAGICGTVQLVLDLPENQPHRAELVKMLVHRRARRHGVAAQLMRAAESAALECGRTLLVLDTVTESIAERLYTKLGWQRFGVVPNYALMPDGAPSSATFFYKDLTSAAE
ncbi:MAG TPA: GNAT family N-acetyltransferase [Gemmatimonadaceae bacterium]